MTSDIDNWYGLYGKKWSGLIVPEATAHPAKFSFKLIQRIYQMLLDDYGLKPSDRVLDPFGGVALGAWPALCLGLTWEGVELEPRFVELAQKNIDRWNQKYGSCLPRWGQAIIHQGDSRRLGEVVGRVGAIVTSPPYAAQQVNPGNVGNAIKRETWGTNKKLNAHPDGYGSTPGQLASLPEGSYQAVVSSPPFVDSIGSDDPTKRGGLYRDPKRANDTALTATYGTEPGQLGGMAEGNYQAIVSSPPYAGSVNQPDGANDTEARIKRMANAGIDTTNRANVGGPNGVARTAQAYGKTEGQLGALPEGNYQAIVSSPPYSNGCAHTGGEDPGPDKLQGTKDSVYGAEYGSSTGQLSTLPEGDYFALVTSPPFAGNTGGRGEASRNGIDPALFDRHSGGMRKGTGDGEPGNLDHMPLRDGDFQAVVTSPPFTQVEGFRDKQFSDQWGPKQLRTAVPEGYGTTPGQLGNDNPDTFWSASKTILEQCYQLLTPGGVAVFVLKDYIKQGKRVPFCDRWRQLAEAVGFTTERVILAWQVNNRGVGQVTLDGEVESKETRFASFFRLLAEKNGSPKVEYEVVLVVRKSDTLQEKARWQHTTE